MRNRAKYKAVAALFLAGGLVAGCGGWGGGADDERLTIYTAREQNISDRVVKEFTAANPQYSGKINLINIGASEILERVRAEKANPRGDVWWGGTKQELQQASDASLLAPWQPGFAAQIPAEHKDQAGKWYGEIQLPEVIMTNTKAVKPDQAPKDWDDLLAPQWKDKIIIRDVPASGTMRTIYNAMIYRAAKGGADPKPGFDWLCKLDASTKRYAANPSDLYLRMSREEGVLSLWNLQDVLIQQNQEKMPFGVVIPSSGVPVLTDGVGVIQGGPNSEGAKKFLEFIYSDKIRAELAKDFYQIPTVPLKDKPEWLAKLDIKPMKLDWDQIQKNDQQWISHWNDRIKGRC